MHGPGESKLDPDFFDQRFQGVHYFPEGSNPPTSATFYPEFQVYVLIRNVHINKYTSNLFRCTFGFLLLIISVRNAKFMKSDGAKIDIMR